MIYPYQEARREAYHSINAIAARYYRKCLETSKAGLRYCEEREIDTGSRRAFRIGYALPGWHGLASELTLYGADPEDAVACGLLSRNVRGYHDRMRGRLVFPVTDAQKRVIAFSGRLVEAGDGSQPKYWNSPETPVYVKGHTLYGLPQSAERLKLMGSIVLVEGNVDVVMAHQHGFCMTVAPLGTALTAPQAASLASAAHRVYLALDADEAGRKAAMRAVPLLWEAGIRDVRLTSLPDGQDPDTTLRGHNGPIVFARALEAATMVTREAVKEYQDEQSKQDDLRRGGGASAHHQPFVGSISEPWRGQSGAVCTARSPE